jgi:hypothetical protein
MVARAPLRRGSGLLEGGAMGAGHAPHHPRSPSAVRLRPKLAQIAKMANFGNEPRTCRSRARQAVHIGDATVSGHAQSTRAQPTGSRVSKPLEALTGGGVMAR